MPQHTVVKTESYGSRVKSSFVAFFIGIVVFIAAFALIFFNTRNYLRTGDDIKQMAEIAVNVSADNPAPENEGKLVAVSGGLTFSSEPYDATFGVSANAPLIKRVVEVCQWKEDSRTVKSGGKSTTTYSYKTVWSQSKCVHNNVTILYPEVDWPPEYEEEFFASPDAKLGSFALNESLLSQMQTSETVTVQPTNIPAGFTQSGRFISNYDGDPSTNDPNDTQIGAIRISYKAYNAKTVSVLAVQTGDGFAEFKAQSGKSYAALMEGNMGKEAITNALEKQNAIMYWIFMGILFVAMLVGFLMIFGPISTLASVVPVLRGLAGGAVFLVSLLLALGFGLLAFSLSWLIFRPVLGAVFLVTALALIILGVKSRRKKGKAARMENSGGNTFAPAAPTSCHNCGTLLQPGVKFCSGCGSPMR